MATISEKLIQLNTNLGTINTEVGSQADLIAQIKNVLAGNVIEVGPSTPIAYTVSSVDELPSNAVNGSMAIVESESMKGTWELGYREYNFRDYFDQGDTCLYTSCRLDDSELGEFTTDQIYGVGLIFKNDMDGDIIGLLYSTSEDDYGDYYENGDWYRTRIITFDKNWYESDFPEAYRWIKETARRISGGYSLYIHENGEWVYVKEVGEPDKPLAYTLSSVDELPADAVDGSMAIVEGTREAMENTTWMLDQYFSDNLEGKAKVFPLHFSFRDGTEVADAILVKDFGYIEISYVTTGGGVYDDGWGDENDRFITIIDEPTTEVAEWVRSHGEKDDGYTVYIPTYSLYTHENGEWVYKCEIA